MNETLTVLNVVKVLGPSTVSFIVGILITPLLTHYLYKYKMWKKRVKDTAIDGRAAPIVNRLTQKEIATPRMGGVIVWGSVVITALIFWVFAVADGTIAEKLNFFSRNQTWLPIFTLIVGAIIGLIDDWLTVSDKLDYLAGGLSLYKRLGVVLVVSLIGAWWFFSKLEMTNVIVPFLGEYNIGIWFVPFFIIVMMALYSGGVIDGVDGLSGGVFSASFAAYGTIAYFQDQIDLAAFSFVVVGGLLAFLWFNIPPARFYLSETGTMSLTLTLGVVAFLTKQVLVLPIVALPLAVTTLSVIIQVVSKKIRDGKKVFLAAPIHHHFEAKGWPGYKVTMRYWVISVIVAVLGVIVALIG